MGAQAMLCKGNVQAFIGASQALCRKRSVKEINVEGAMPAVRALARAQGDAKKDACG